MRRRRDLCGGDGLEGLLHRLHHFDRPRQRLARNFSARRGRAIDRAQQHLFAASAARQQPDSNFDQPGVEFGMRLARRSVQ